MEEKINRHCICAVCFKRTQKSACRPMSGQKNEKLRHFVFDTYNITITDEKSVICNKFRQKYNNFYRRNLRPNTDVKERFDPTYLPTQEPEMNNNSQEELHFNVAIKRAGASHACCFLCRKPGPKMVTVKKAARFDLFVKTGVLLAKSARCCPRHFCLEHFDNESIQRVLKNEIKISNESNFSSKEMSDVIEHVRLLAYKNQNKRIVFDNFLDEEAYVTLTGLDKASFNDLATHVTDVRKSQYRNTNNCLGVFLTKMRTGLSNQILATLFHMKKSHVRRSIAKIRNSLSGSFVRSHLGFDHISRKNVIQTKTRPLAKIFSENENSPPAILVLDGTYLYIQKSSQFKFQRKTFSMHKKRPLVKPMMVVTTSGYIVSVIGPYFSNGKNNDASILSHIIRQNTEQIKSWLHSDDVFIVDRGFRDSLSYLKEIGIRAEMPTFLQKGEKQLSSADANKTRLITKVRWVVESANARLKQWRFFEKVVPNSHLPHLQTYLRITCAILNKYKPPLSQTKNELDDISEATKMLALSKQNNSLQQFVNDKLDRSRKCWKSIHSVELQDFPKLNDQQLRDLTVGVYTLRLAKSYTYEHLIDESYELLVSKEYSNILAVKLQSRHTSNHCHKLWIQYSKEAILGWYCKCPAGSRVVGTCAHVASVVWFLSKGEELQIKPRISWLPYLLDAAEP